MNNHHLNGSLENLKFIYKADYKHDLSMDKLEITIDNVREEIRHLYSDLDQMGKILSPVPDLIIEGNDGIKRINIDENYQ